MQEINNQILDDVLFVFFCIFVKCFGWDIPRIFSTSLNQLSLFLVWLYQPPVQINICLAWFGFTPLYKRLRETQLQCALT